MHDSLKVAIEAIEKRFGVPIEEYVKGANRSPEVQAKIDATLKKETEELIEKYGDEDSAEEMLLSEAIKKIGVRSAFGLSAVDMHRYERKGIEKMYPTEEELRIIVDWSHDDLIGLMEYIKERWEYADCGYWEQIDNEYYLSTAGWSGNEAIIQAMSDNFIFWSMCWYSSKRGGHYKFILPNIE